MSDNFLLNSGIGLGGGLGAMPVALPYSLGGAIPGIFGAALPEDTRNQILGAAAGGVGAALPMGMINRDGQQFMGQQQPQQTEQPADKGMSNSDMMKMASMAMQGFNRGQQGIQAPTQQIIRDQNQFRFAGQQQNPQMLAQALRRRG